MLTSTEFCLFMDTLPKRQRRHLATEDPVDKSTVLLWGLFYPQRDPQCGLRRVTWILLSEALGRHFH